jgi:hypothetical protein
MVSEGIPKDTFDDLDLIFIRWVTIRDLSTLSHKTFTPSLSLPRLSPGEQDAQERPTNDGKNKARQAASMADLKLWSLIKDIDLTRYDASNIGQGQSDAHGCRSFPLGCGVARKPCKIAARAAKYAGRD